MTVQLIEASVDVDAFPFGAVIESDLFGMRQQFRVNGAILTLQLLFNGCEAAEGRRNVLDDEATESVPGESERWALPSDQLGEPLGEEIDV